MLDTTDFGLVLQSPTRGPTLSFSLQVLGGPFRGAALGAMLQSILGPQLLLVAGPSLALASVITHSYFVGLNLNDSAF